MEYNITLIINGFIASFVNFYNSPFMLVVKILIGIYLLVVFVDLVLLLILRNVGEDIRVGLRGMNLPTTSKGKMQKRWDKVKERLNGSSPSQYKVAIIEADAIADELLAGIGYKGGDMLERLEDVAEKHLDEHLEALKGAHKIRNQIVHEVDFVVDQRMAAAVVGVYENFLRYLEFLD